MTPLLTIRTAFWKLCRSKRAVQPRFNSTQAGQKQVSPHVGFYKTFTRPVAKVLLMATFTYQLTYWAWVKLEKDEIKREKTGEETHVDSGISYRLTSSEQQK
ncbi:hypothetical protein EG329_003350 [Mollisiaceae sp. DMI_Dod_QoI]|nr:hypothetical protein EG329_003350 [Helotiales sp. DMI_Dod_QoI]